VRVCWEIRVCFYAWTQDQVDAGSDPIRDRNITDSSIPELGIWHCRVEVDRNVSGRLDNARDEPSCLKRSNERLPCFVLAWRYNLAAVTQGRNYLVD